LQRAHSMLQLCIWNFLITMQYHYKTLLTCWDIFSWGCWSLPQTPRCQLALYWVLQLRTQHRASVFWQSNTGTHSTGIHTLLFSWTTFFALCLETITLILIQYNQDCVRHGFYCKESLMTFWFPFWVWNKSKYSYENRKVYSTHIFQTCSLKICIFHFWYLFITHTNLPL
jgi:hypothetical protein